VGGGQVEGGELRVAGLGRQVALEGGQAVGEVHEQHVEAALQELG